MLFWRRSFEHSCPLARPLPHFQVPRQVSLDLHSVLNSSCCLAPVACAAMKSRSRVLILTPRSIGGGYSVSPGTTTLHLSCRNRCRKTPIEFQRQYLQCSEPDLKRLRARTFDLLQI